MRKALLVTLSLAVVLTGLVALGQMKAWAADNYRFTLVAHSIADTFWVPVKKGAEDAAKMLGVKVTFTGPAEWNVQKQVNIFESVMSSDVDGIATTLPDPQAFDGIVQKALDKGIPVVAFNTDDSTPNPRMACIAQDQIAAGQTAGEEVVKYVPDGGKVALTICQPGQNALEQRLQGIKDVLDEHNIDYKVLNTTTDLVKAVETIMNYYRANPDTDGWFGTGGLDTSAGAKAVEKLNLKGKVAAGGFDLVPTTTQGILNGYTKFTIDQNPYLQGFYAVEELYLYKEYGIYPSEIDTGAGIVDSSNVERVLELSQKGYR